MSFTNFGFKEYINQTLKNIDFKEPTSIQTKVIPLLKKHQNVVALAHTGTGKTHAFLLPILNNLDLNNTQNVQAVIIAPTRELAAQIAENLKPFSQKVPAITVGLFIGGTDFQRDLENLNKNQPMIVVGTPTKLKELYTANALKLTTANYVVVDECDMIFDLDFIEDVDFLLNKMHEKTTIAFFSATINQQLQQYLKKYLRHSHFIDDSQAKPTTKNIQHFLIDTKNKELNQTLTKILKSINPYLCLIFVNQKKEIASVLEILKQAKIHQVGELHADLPPRTRATMIKKIKHHDFRYVVVTDLAARGVNIDHVSDVISLNLPQDLNYYIHRSGRTGRKNAQGKSYVLMNAENQSEIQKLKTKGIEFKVMKFVGDNLVLIPNKKSKSQKSNDAETQAIINKYKNTKVKPGYKKKRQAELEALQKKRRRQHIKESIEKIKKDKYRKRRKDIFED